MNYKQINKRLSTAIEIIAWAEEEMKKEIDWDDPKAVDLAFGLSEAGGRLLRIRHEFYKKYRTMNQTFRIGDKVRLKDGDGRTHIIKEIPWEYNLKGNGQFAVVTFEDNAAKGFISDDGYTDMIKIEDTK